MHGRAQTQIGTLGYPTRRNSRARLVITVSDWLKRPGVRDETMARSFCYPLPTDLPPKPYSEIRYQRERSRTNGGEQELKQMKN